LSGCVIICPIGFVDQYILDRIVRCIESRCKIACKISSKMEVPEYAFDERRSQYNSKLILKNLIAQCPEDALKFMGVTQVDLFVPILKYVFGVAQLEGPCSVISLHRLFSQFYEEPPNSGLFIERVKKTALHELGHSLGLTHCQDRSCVMHSSTSIEDTDYKKHLFCPTCFELFTWYLENM
jgi:archaemetzincin